MNPYTNTPVRTVLDRISSASGFTVEHVLARSRRPDLDRVRSDIYVALKDGKGMSFQAIGNVCNRKRNTVYSAYKRRKDKTVLQAKERDYIDELEAQIRRLLGQDAVYQVADRLEVPVGQAAFLTILGEAYPTILPRENFSERYDLLMDRIFRRNDKESHLTAHGLNKQLQLLRGRMAAQGLPDPVTRIVPGGLRLSHDIAPWLHHQFGTPVFFKAPQQKTG